jgi:integrase
MCQVCRLSPPVWALIYQPGEGLKGLVTAESANPAVQTADGQTVVAGWPASAKRNTGPVFATRDGGELDANIRREFRAAINAAGIKGAWSPRELRHTFVSLMSDGGVPVEEIARLAGHATSRTPEIVYRHQLRPVMERGAQAMDQLLGRTA